MDVSITWTRSAQQTYRDLLLYIGAHSYGDPAARDREVLEAIELLRHAPHCCRTLHVRAGKSFRQLVTVKGRFLVYYIYFPPRGPKGRGRISIRAVKHAALKHPFLGVREPTPARYGVE